MGNPIDSKQISMFVTRLGREHPVRQNKRIKKKFEELDMFDLYDFATEAMISNRELLFNKIEDLEKRIKILEKKQGINNDNKFDKRGIRKRKSL